ncbi:MAG TPA: glycosyltransferase family 2 protein [Mycobacteriales bacterium]|jgi:GT2 family glycosyltransferase|nr:glycosyltransferase family 2 protein [Mycobacteriales bacterium]
MPPRARLAHPHHRVTAVVVSHDGARWLPDVLAALAAQTRPAQRVVAADTGSNDASPALLAEAFGADAVTALPRTTGFGAAVAAALAHADATGAERPPPRRRASDTEEPREPVRWVWLLHDDSAPEPDALERLVEAAEAMPSATVLGPKARDWDDPRLLVEVGFTIDRAGRRETGLERREFDQGQHDDAGDVLAVGSAGMLVRRDVWDALGGFDPRLPLFRDDLDLGWRANAAGHRVTVVPAARIRHARAATLGRRPLAAAHGSAHGVDRRHSLAVLLANLPALAAVLAAPRLLAGALLRTVGFLLTRQVAEARDEVAAVAWNVRHLPDLLRARRRRRATRTLPWSAVRPLFTGRTARLRGYLEQLGDWLTGGGGDGVAPGEDGDDDLPPPAPRRRGEILTARPGLTTVAAVTVVTLLAARGLLGGGRLFGGALLPAPDGASDLARTYAASWRSTVGAGSAAGAPPAVAVLAALSWLLLGKAWLATDVLVLGCVPLAAATAYATARRLTTSVPLRVWAAVAYAFVPVGTGAVATGHLDAAVALAAAPALLLAGYRLLTDDPRYTGWRTSFGTGLGLAVAIAFAPQLALLAAVPLAVGALVLLLGATPASRAGAVRRIAAVALTLGTALAVLFPWSLRLFTDPGLLAGGTPSARGGAAPRALDLLLLRPGPVAAPWAFVTAGLLLAALAALVRERRVGAALACWGVAAVAYADAFVSARGTGSLPATFPGVPLAVAAAALVAAAVLAADGARERLAARSFGWRQPTAALLAAVAAVGPLVAAGAWVTRGAAHPLDRTQPARLPAAAVAQLDREPGSRVLWLRADDDAGVSYVLSAPEGPDAGDADLPRPGVAMRLLDRLVGDLAVPRGSTAAEGLATFAVRYVAVADPVPGWLATALDAQSGLARVNFQGDVRVWRTLTPAARLTVLPPVLAGTARSGAFATRDQLRLTPPAPLHAFREAARTTVPAGADGRLLALSERADRGWVATLDGKPLRRVTVWGWAQGFELPANGGVLRLRHDGSRRDTALAVQGLLLLVALVLAAPSVRRADDEPDPDAEDTTPPEPALAGAAPGGPDAPRNVRTVR